MDSFTAKWEKNNYIEAQKYQMTYPSIASAGLGYRKIIILLKDSQICNAELFFSDEITSVLCVPIKSLQKSSQGMPDWICIVLGFRSGSIQMYTTVSLLSYVSFYIQLTLYQFDLVNIIILIHFY